MDSLMDIQDDVKSKIDKAVINFKKCPKDRLTLSALENLETKVERVPKTTRALHVVKDKGVSCAFCAATTLLGFVKTLSSARCANAATTHCYTHKVFLGRKLVRVVVLLARNPHR
ncbi:hypothetical protein HW555_003189 [Spodoptera exigua]|uniref:Uncharacterized protein n=1 Tax=Spodoptera exigua TaxID=7107 RepID=A0A835L6E2_SPOEX|nr:hypothetical protein HW555_003189 [Spodoptera exigua]